MIIQNITHTDWYIAGRKIACYYKKLWLKVFAVFLICITSFICLGTSCMAHSPSPVPDSAQFITTVDFLEFLQNKQVSEIYVPAHIQGAEHIYDQNEIIVKTTDNHFYSTIVKNFSDLEAVFKNQGIYIIYMGSESASEPDNFLIITGSIIILMAFIIISIMIGIQYRTKHQLWLQKQPFSD